MQKPLRGILPPVATPFVDGELDLPGFRHNVERWNGTGLSGFLVLGSNGETPYLEEREKEALLAAAREAATSDKILMAGTGCEATASTVRFTRRAAELGADFALVLTPHFFKSEMTAERLEAHYRTVADAASIPILLYNAPQYTGVNIGPRCVARLADHPNIVGLKDSSGNIGQLAEIARITPEDFAVFAGAAGVFYPALCVGACGGILAVANAVPERCVEIWEAYRKGDHAKALEAQRVLAPLIPLLTSVCGVAGLKAAMDLTGYRGGNVRSPLTPVGPEVREQIAAELRKLGF